MQGCPWCKKAEDLLKKHNKKYQSIPGVGNKDVDELMRKNNRTDYKYWPKIFLNDIFIGGYIDLEKRLAI